MPVERDITDILDGQVRIYRRKDAGDVWHYRFWVKEYKRYVRKSTGTKKLTEAKEIAGEAFYVARAKISSNIPVFSKTFHEVFDLALKGEWRKVERGELSEKRYEDFKRWYNRYYKKFFKKRLVSGLTTSVCEEYWNYRIDFWRNMSVEKRKKFMKENNICRISEVPAGSTLHLEKRVLDMVVDKAIRLNVLSDLAKPDTSPPAKNIKTPRPALSMDQWKRIRDFMCDVYPYMSGSGMNDQKRRVRWLLYYYVTFLVTTGIRIGALRNVKWEHINRYQEPNGPMNTSIPVYGKNKDYVVNVKEGTYELLQEWRSHPFNKCTKNNDYIFGKENGDPLPDMWSVFTKMLETAEKDEHCTGISQDHKGNAITLYSMRSTFACFEIQYHGTSYDDLASTMGTSIKIIEEHYAQVPTPARAKRLNMEASELFRGTNIRFEDTVEEREQKFEVSLFGDQEQRKQRKIYLAKLLAGEISKEEYRDLMKI